MSYLVLARKYRPRTFADVVGQPHVIRPLTNALITGRVAHAFLFTGARGVGKTTAARLLAAALNCSAPEPDRPCGQCEACLEIHEGQAVDVFEIDGASNRGIDQIRDLRETIRYLPSKGRYKVYIIDEVHMLTKEAFNALLKTLEEPPSHVVFIFATTEAHKVLPTILSRCQRYDFKRIGTQDLVDRLEDIAQKENITISPAALRLLAREAEGGLRDALSQLDQVIAFAGLQVSDADVADALGLIDRTLVAGLAKALLEGRAGDALDILDQVFHFGYDAKDFAVQLLAYFRSLAVAKVSRRPQQMLDLLDDELAEIQALARTASLETLHFHFNAWLETQTRLARSLQPRLVLEAQVIRLAQTAPLQTLSDLAARLEALLSSAGSPPARRDIPAPGPREAPPRIPLPGSSPGGMEPAGPGGGADRPSGGGAVSRPSTDPAGGRIIPLPDPISDPAGSRRTDERPAFPKEKSPAAKPDPGPRDGPGFIKFLQREYPMLAALVEQGQIRTMSPDRVELVMGDKGLAGLIPKDDLSLALNQYLLTRPVLVIRHEEGVVGPAGNGSAKERLRKELTAHPLVQEAQRLFSAQLVDVIPDDELQPADEPAGNDRTMDGGPADGPTDEDPAALAEPTDSDNE